jgi:hypothetical protein
VEVIHDETLATNANNNVEVMGGFRMKELTFYWLNVNKDEKRRRTSVADYIRCELEHAAWFLSSCLP